jgi:hypothetical protein
VISQARYVQSICTRTIWVSPSNLSAKSASSKSKKEPGLAASSKDENDKIRISILIIGARKKVHLLSYLSGKPHTVREIALPHTPRLMLFPAGVKAWGSYNEQKDDKKRAPTVHLHYNANDWGILEVDLFATERGSAAGLRVSEPPVSTGSTTTSNPSGSGAAGPNLGMTPSTNAQDKTGGLGVGAAFGGLGGYVGKGFRAVSGASTAINSIVGLGVGSDYIGEEGEAGAEPGDTVTDGETLVLRGDQGVFYDSMGRMTNTPPIDFSSTGDSHIPDDMVFADPFIISAIPASSPTSSTTQNQNSSSGSKIEVRLKQTLAVQQEVAVGGGQVDLDSPAAATTGAGHIENMAIRCLSVSTRSTSRGLENDSTDDVRPSSAFWMTVPLDKLQLQTEGSALWCLRGEPWKAILEDSLREGRFEDGRGMLTAMKGRKVEEVDSVSPARAALF